MDREHKSLKEIADIVEHYLVGLNEEDVWFLYSEIERLEAQEQRIEELEAELQKKSEFLRATAKTLFSERRSQEDTAIRWVLDKDGFVPPRRS